MSSLPPLRDSSETVELLRRAGEGDDAVLDDLFSRHRSRLERMVALRMAEKLRPRIDPADVVQDALLQASRRLSEYLEDPGVPFFLWLRYLTRQRLAELHRFHLGAQARDPRREVAIYQRAMPAATTQALAAQLLGRLDTPSQQIARVELQVKLQEGLNRMDASDREIIALRHFEQLTNVEVARELDIKESAASKRYIRALERLQKILSQLGIESFLD